MQYAESLLLNATDPTVQAAQRRTTTAYLIALIASAGLWGWHYAVYHHLQFLGLAVILVLFAGCRIGGYFICRLESQWTRLATLPAWLLLLVNVLLAAIRPLN